MKKNSDIEFLSSILDFWGTLNSSQEKLILDNITHAKYTKGQNIHTGESDCKGAIILKSGSLRTYILSEDGREITLYRLYKGDICILSASCVIKNITFDVHIDADTDCELILLSSSVLSSLTKENIYIECFTYKTMIDRFSKVMWTMEQILFMSFDKRLAIFLIDESSKQNSNYIPLTHEQIAKYMGSAREVVSRMLKYFANEGIVELSRGGVKLIDKGKLYSLVN